MAGLFEDVHVFLYNPQINVCVFFQDVNLEIFRPSVLSISYRCLYITVCELK